MPSYEVSFLKDVLDGTGHDRAVVQRKLEIVAPDKEQAMAQGVAVFCEEQRVDDWHARADRIEVEEADFPS